MWNKQEVKFSHEHHRRETYIERGLTKLKVLKLEKQAVMQCCICACYFSTVA